MQTIENIKTLNQDNFFQEEAENDNRELVNTLTDTYKTKLFQKLSDKIKTYVCYKDYTEYMALERKVIFRFVCN